MTYFKSTNLLLMFVSNVINHGNVICQFRPSLKLNLFKFALSSFMSVRLNLYRTTP